LGSRVSEEATPTIWMRVALDDDPPLATKVDAARRTRGVHQSSCAAGAPPSTRRWRSARGRALPRKRRRAVLAEPVWEIDRVFQTPPAHEKAIWVLSQILTALDAEHAGCPTSLAM